MNQHASVTVETIDLARSISAIADLCHPVLAEHHHLTAYITARLAAAMGAPDDEAETWTLAAALHDLGALSLGERLAALDLPLAFEDEQHSEPGAALVSTFPPFAEAGAVIRFHHRWWDRGEGAEPVHGIAVPKGSFVVAVADRIAVLAVSPGERATLPERTLEYLRSKSDTQFDPDLVSAFADIADEAAFWYDIDSIRAGGDSAASSSLWHPLASGRSIDMDEARLDELARMAARLIDFKSRFTASHSVGVSVVAHALADLLDLSADQRKRLRLAGYLHDAGKMAVPTELLEKPGPLTEDEWRVVQTHPYLTYRMLASMPCWQDLSFAALHHQKPDGTGYPFHLEPDEVPLEAAVMTVADVATALTEDRPYREGMGHAAADVMRQMQREGRLDAEVAETLFRNFDVIDEIRAGAQAAAVEDFEEFTRSYREDGE